MITLFGPEGGFVRRTIGFKSEVVIDVEDQEPFPVVSSTPMAVERTAEMATWEGAVCKRSSARSR